MCGRVRDGVTGLTEGPLGSVAPCDPRKAIGCPNLIGCLEASAQSLLALNIPVRSRRWKRMLDCTVLLMTLPAWGPLMFLIALAVKCMSRGPVFFRQTRYGLNGNPFTLLKFRTMKSDAPTESHERHLESLMTSNRAMTKLDVPGDDRLIPFGLTLRATGLDELPQFLNVLLGQMSLVGPRPCTAFEYGLYADWQKKRFQALPGLTGLWQVSGKNKTSFTQMVLLDIYYALHSSPGMDLRIMRRTLPALWSQVDESVLQPAAVNRELGMKMRSQVAVERAD